MSRLEIRALGPPAVTLDGSAIDTSRHKAVALLVYLAVTGERHRREALATLFWPEYAQSKAYDYLRRTVWEIKDALGEGWLDADRKTVGWRWGRTSGSTWRRFARDWLLRLNMATRLRRCVRPASQSKPN